MARRILIAFILIALVLVIGYSRTRLDHSTLAVRVATRGEPGISVLSSTAFIRNGTEGRIHLSPGPDILVLPELQKGQVTLNIRSVTLDAAGKEQSTKFPEITVALETPVEIGTGAFRYEVTAAVVARKEK
jgi:hypothetical protein